MFLRTVKNSSVLLQSEMDKPVPTIAKLRLCMARGSNELFRLRACLDPCLSPSLPSLLQLTVSRRMNLCRSPRKHDAGRHVSDRGVEPHLVVVANVSLDDVTRLFDIRQRGDADRLGL